MFLEISYETDDTDHPIIVEQPFSILSMREQFWKYLVLKSPPVNGLLRMGCKYEVRIRVFTDETKQEQFDEFHQWFVCTFQCPYKISSEQMPEIGESMLSSGTTLLPVFDPK